ncbi:hypothetical protein HZS55_11480 [Halosimplex rubrum]|uniref:Uncharacterized protein n=1 Tax=Halosimplex rubrum TaxID=869889 RepID=A0A7D5P332_9EURY|nr:hypothetical protein [Halosimplex rubrum]QLH77881.1 hypothetical protein HZS55_11480 [Halosimplex rubrum]
MTSPAVVVTRTALRQTYRRVRESKRMTAFFLLIPGFFALQVSGLVGPGAYDLGRRFAAGEVAPVVARVRGTVLSGVVLLALMGTLGAAGGNSEFKDRYVTFLTATSTRAVAVGSVARQTAVWTALFWPVALAGAVAFAVGAEAPVAAVSLVAGSLWLFVVAGVATAPIGFGARWLLDGYGLSKNARFGLGVGMLGLFYLVLFTRRTVGAALGATPLSWAGDLLLLTVRDAGASPARAGGFLLATVGLVLGSLAASVRLAEAVWYDDRALGDDDEEAGDDPATATPVRDVLASVVPRPTAALVETTWRRTKRTPKTLWYVYPAVFVGLVMAEQLVYSGPFDAAMYAPVVAFTGALAAGSGFTLNPLGTEGDALPALLTAGVSSETFVRAKAYAVVLPVMPLLVGAALGTAIGVGVSSPLVVAAIGVFAVALAVVAPLCSLALGVHYPPGDEGLLGEDVQIPNKSASAAYTLGMVTVGAPGLGALGAYARPSPVDPATVAVGVGATAILAALVAWGGYRHAVAKLDAYSVE